MKKILILISIIFLVGCSASSSSEADSAAGDDLKDTRIVELETQVGSLTGILSTLQSDYDELEAASADSGSSSGSHICDVNFGSMKYQNPTSAVAILEGWFALQEEAQELQGTFSTEFWTGVDSLIHTIRYIHVDTGASITTSFLIYFQEADWSDGLFWVTEQCWLDFPG